MKDGDIYCWRYKDEIAKGGCGSWGAYHCKSQRARVRNGQLFDTYWSSPSDGSWLNPEEIDLEYLGNENELQEIPSSKVAYYDRSDVIDMRHMNNTRDKVYIKPGTKLSADAMMSHAKAKLEDAESDIRVAESRAERYREVITQIENGDLEKVFL